MSDKPPGYLLRQRQKITSELLLRGTSREFDAVYDTHIEGETASFFEKVIAELVGRDGPSAIGKGLRALVPIWVAYSFGLLPRKPEVIWGAFAIYGVAAAIWVMVRRSKRKAARAKEKMGDQAWAAAAEKADAALASSRVLLKREFTAEDPEYVRAMRDLNDANIALLTALKIPKRPWNLWRFTARAQLGA